MCLRADRGDVSERAECGGDWSGTTLYAYTHCSYPFFKWAMHASCTMQQELGKGDERRELGPVSHRTYIYIFACHF